MSTLFNLFERSDLTGAALHIEEAWPVLAGANLFITGGTGFLGQWLVSLLLTGADDRGLDLQMTLLSRDPDRFAARHPDIARHVRVTLKQGDVEVFEFPKGRFTHVIHAATDTGVAADKDPLRLIDSIVNGTRRTLEFARACGAKRFLMLSSGAVYGPMSAGVEAFAEDDIFACPTDAPSSNYGQSKRMAEQLCTVFQHTLDLHCNVARCFSHVGPGMALDAHFAVGNFIRDAASGKDIVLNGDGTPVRSYLYGADTAAWLVKVLTHGEPGRFYNVGSDKADSLAAIAHTVADALGTLGVQVLGQGQPGHRNRYVPNVDRARSELGLNIWTPLATAAQKTAAWAARDRPWSDDGPSFGTQEGSDGSRMTFVVDIDGVIACLTQGNDYTRATPLEENVMAINALYDAGHEIILMTARGYKTGIDWKDLTVKQMLHWGVKYHELKFGKPAADYYVDDRMLSIAAFNSLARQVEKIE